MPDTEIPTRSDPAPKPGLDSGPGSGPMQPRLPADGPVVFFAPGPALDAAACAPGAPASPDLRAALLRETLRAWCRAAGPRLEMRELADGAAPVAALAALSGFEPARAPQAPHVFVGLVNAPEAHLGRNILLLTRPLEQELAAFAARNGGEAGLPPLWWKDLLRNYHRVVLLDAADYGRSFGFAPWARLQPAGDFRLVLPAGAGAGAGIGAAADGAVLVVNHDPAAPLQELRARYAPLAARQGQGAGQSVSQSTGQGTEPGEGRLWLLSPGAPLPAPLSQLAGCALHLHHGYRAGAPVFGLHPADSVAAGAGTLAVARAGEEPEEPEASAEAGFATVADAGTALERAAAALARLARLGGSGAGAEAGTTDNPELRRRRQAGTRHLAAQFRALTALVTA